MFFQNIRVKERGEIMQHASNLYLDIDRGATFCIDPDSLRFFPPPMEEGEAIPSANEEDLPLRSIYKVR